MDIQVQLLQYHCCACQAEQHTPESFLETVPPTRSRTLKLLSLQLNNIFFPTSLIQQKKLETANHAQINHQHFAQLPLLNRTSEVRSTSATNYTARYTICFKTVHVKQTGASAQLMLMIFWVYIFRSCGEKEYQADRM